MSAVSADILPPIPLESSSITLPLERPRSKAYSTKRATAGIFLAADARAALEGPSNNRVSALVAAVGAVLYRYSGEPVLCIGTAPQAAAPPNSIPVPLTLGPEMTLGQLRANAEATLRDLHSRIQIPFARLIEQLGMSEVTNRNPLFAIAVRDAATQAELTDSRADVVLTLSADSDAALEVNFSARLFSATTVARFLGHVERMLAHMLRPAQLLRSVGFLSTHEKDELFTRGRGRVDVAPAAESVIELFARQVQRTPDALALVAEKTLWTYTQLDTLTDALAASLQRRGIEHGTRVGLCVLIGPPQLMWLLAILKCGATVVPFDWTLPIQRIRRLYADAAIQDLVTENRLLGLFPEGSRALVLEERDHDSSSEGQFRPQPITGADAIYLLYTSGSTGHPKAVVMPHRAITNLVTWQDRQSGWRAARTLHRTSISFDVSWQEIFSTWCFGSALVIASEEQRADISSWPALIEDHSITRIFVPVVALHQLAELVRKPLAALAEIIVAGEQLRITPAVRRAFQLLQARLVNQYGPTETHVVTEHVLDDVSHDWPVLPPLGTPVDHARVMVLDPFGYPAPIGVDGEICIAGVPLALRYHGDEPLTAAKFAPGVTPELQGNALYRTGDFGHVTEGGVLEFTGRRDNQIKLRGYRIELGELEGAMSGMPGIRQAAASIWTDDDGERRLAAHIVQTEEGRLSPIVIRAYLRERLPDYMVPPTTCILFTNSLPLTASGKIDRKRLPRPEGIMGPERAPGQNLDSVAQIVRDVWVRNLHTETIGPNDGFLELGGHSLLAIHIVSEINERLGTAIPLGELLRGPTFGNFTNVVENAQRRDSAHEAPLSSKQDVATEVTLPNGMKVLAPFAPEAHYLFSDIYEYQTYDQYGLRYNPGACIVDLGANIGLFTLYAAGRAPGCKVFAVEPAVPLWQALRRNVDRLGDQVVPINCAISNRDGTAALTYYPAVPGMSSLYPDTDHERTLLSQILGNLSKNGRPEIRGLMEHDVDFVGQRLANEIYPCRVMTFSKLLRELAITVVDLLKIDVQKSELDVLEGIEEGDWPRIRQIVVEVHNIGGRTRQISEVLSAKGYSVTIGEQCPIHQGSVIHFVYAIRRDG